MDIRGNKVRFTASEAHWAQDACSHFGIKPELGQRIQDSRVALAQQWLAPDDLPATISKAKQNAMSLADHLETLKLLHEVTLTHTMDLSGQEQPVIEVAMSRQEKELLLGLAQDEYEVVRYEVDTPELAEIEHQEFLDDAGQFVITSDVMTPEDALTLNELLRDPAMRASYGPQYEDFVQQAEMLGPLITALETDLA